jgi:S-formylglutathione hydrolase FrmB
VAGYGGYSAFYLAGIHNNRFKTFIAHDGVFNTQSMFGKKFSSAIGILVHIGKDNAIAKPIPHSTLLI